jgi:hypothetical protein
MESCSFQTNSLFFSLSCDLASRSDLLRSSTRLTTFWSCSRENDGEDERIEETAVQYSSHAMSP